MPPLLQGFRIPEERQVIEHRIALGERHIVRQSRTRQRHRHVVDELVVTIDDAVVHVGRVRRVIEKHEFTRRLVDFLMG